jgi:hypothetical protein
MVYKNYGKKNLINEKGLLQNFSKEIFQHFLRHVSLEIRENSFFFAN